MSTHGNIRDRSAKGYGPSDLDIAAGDVAWLLNIYSFACDALDGRDQLEAELRRYRHEEGATWSTCADELEPILREFADGAGLALTVSRLRVLVALWRWRAGDEPDGPSQSPSAPEESRL